MELQTRLKIPQHPNPISYESEILLMGSCFSGHMGDKLSYYQFRNTQNPFGTLFHPRAISNLIDRAIEGRYFTGDDCFYHMERWHSHHVHSDLSNPDPEALVRTLKGLIDMTGEQLKNISHLVITLGTAWGYVQKETEMWVSNCHKVPQSKFDKFLSSPEEVRNDLSKSLASIYEINPDVSVILTVSPVRHARDGFVENQRSKSHLFVALHQLLEEHGDRNIHYFPAYELMMDELRDYRFYGSDLLHPNEVAVDYIWEKFTQALIDESAYPDMNEVGAIKKGLAHRPQFPESEEYRKFMQSLEHRIQTMKKKYPFMSF